MTSPTQLPIPFDHRPALSGEDFLVAPGNADAVAWIDRWPDWPSPFLVIAGPEGSGKTHLANVFLQKSGATTINADELVRRGADDVVSGARALVIEDAPALIEAGAEELLLHLYNLAREADIRVLVTAESAPARWAVKLKDLGSRLKTAPVAEIRPPDDALLQALLVKQFSDRQLDVGQDVIAYVVARMDRSFKSARHMVAEIDRLALSEKRAVTIPLVKRVLEKIRF